MSIELSVRPPFRDDWTSVALEGEHADEALNIITSRLVAAEWEVLIEDESGEMVPFEEYEE